MDSMKNRAVPFMVVVSALAAMVVVYRLLVVSYAGQVADQDAMLTLGAMMGNDVPTYGLLGRIQIPVLFAVAATIAAVCIARRSTRLFAYACLVVLSTTIVSIVLQAGLLRPALGIGQLNSFPSKTVAAFAAVGIAVCAVVPRRMLPVAGPAVLAGLAAVSFGVVSLLWHRPSDVIGGILLAVVCAAVAECALPVWRRPDPRLRAARVPDLRQPVHS